MKFEQSICVCKFVKMCGYNQRQVILFFKIKNNSLFHACFVLVEEELELLIGIIFIFGILALQNLLLVLRSDGFIDNFSQFIVWRCNCQCQLMLVVNQNLHQKLVVGIGKPVNRFQHYHSLIIVNFIIKPELVIKGSLFTMECNESCLGLIDIVLKKQYLF